MSSEPTPSKRHLIIPAIALPTLAVAMVVLFQNCGKGFEAAGVLSEQGSSITVPPKPVSCVTQADSPATLSQTCYSQVNKVYSNLKTYSPQYPLYSDGASKKRWYYIPDGTAIDTTDMDNWIYPVGFILWKDFMVAGRKVETRMLEKIAAGTGAASWRTSVYVWRVDQLEADKTADAAAPVAGNSYEFSNIPGYKLFRTNQCVMCHNSATDYSVGFTALQLSNLSNPGNIGTLILAGQISAPPSKPIAIPGTEADKKALGYMSANCGSCHSPGGAAAGVGMNLKFNSAALTLQETNAYLTTVALANGRVTPKDLAASRLYQRVNSNTMPPRAILNTTDPQAVQTLSEWILSL